MQTPSTVMRLRWMVNPSTLLPLYWIRGVVPLGGGTCDNRITEPCLICEMNLPPIFTRQ